MAGGTVKSVSVVYQAFTDKFDKAVDRAGNKMSGFVKKAAGIAAGFIAARASINGVTNAMDKLDRLGKLSDQLEIDPNTLRGLDLAATQTGTSFETMTKGVQRLARTIGEARQGITTGTKALEDIGMAAEDFEGLSVEEQFLKAADAIAKIDDPTKKAAVATRLFGRSGQELLNVLNLGSEGIRNFVREAEELGGPISREDIARVEAANDAIDKMGRAWEGITQQLTIEFAPIIESIADGLRELGQLTRGIADEWKNAQNALTDFFTEWVYFGEGKNVQLGERKKKPPKKPIIEETKENVVKEVVKQFSTQSFSAAITAQSSKAFDVLNPNRNTVQKQQLETQKNIEKNTAAVADAVRDGGTFIRQDIPS